jgi:hypothetical protein
VLRRAVLLLALGPLCLLGAMTAGAAARENYALIVANSDYPDLPQKYWLKGPRNDEALIRDYLLHNAPVPFAPDHIIALGSGDGLQLGTHRAILDSLGTIAREAKPGDFVYLHFSGHGTQQPAIDDTAEPDGRDEVFLSADAQLAPPDNPRFLPNVLTDNEVSGALAAIRKTGAFVWIVFDSCFSGTMTRGAPDAGNVAERRLDPADLGIPPSAFAPPAPDTATERAIPLAAAAEAADGAGMGGLVAFYAAQSSETTSERDYDVSQPDGTTAAVPYGVFTHAIFSALARNPNMTYRQLAQSVLATYAADNMLRPTPLFEGKLDAPVFGSTDAAATQQWPTIAAPDKSLSISAGQLHGLAVGTRLLLLPTPAASDDEAIGLLEVASTTELRSQLVPLSDATHPLVALADVPRGAYVRLLEVSYPFELTVGRPDPATADPAGVGAVTAALDRIATGGKAQLKLRVVDAGQPADVKLAVLSDNQVARLGGTAGIAAASFDPTPKLWLLPSTAEISLEPGRAPPSLPVPAGATAGGTGDPDFDKALENDLVTIFRATGLSRLSETSSFGPKDFELSFGLQQAGSAAIAPMDPVTTPIVRPGDRLHIDLTNASGKPMDVNVLYIDHDYGITLICQAHLATGDRLFQPMADIAASDRGSERLVAVLNESGKDLTDLSFLTQPGLPVATRGPGQNGLLGMLADLGAGVPTRGPNVVATAKGQTPRGAVVMLPVEALDATGAAPAAEITPSDPRTPEGSCAAQ